MSHPSVLAFTISYTSQARIPAIPPATIHSSLIPTVPPAAALPLSSLTLALVEAAAATSADDAAADEAAATADATDAVPGTPSSLVTRPPAGSEADVDAAVVVWSEGEDSFPNAVSVPVLELSLAASETGVPPAALILAASELASSDHDCSAIGNVW